MVKYFFILLVSVISYDCYSQISFEKGYYVDNNGQKMDCLIKNLGWSNNPSSFDYKLSESEDTKTKTIESVKEFGVIGELKYIKTLVRIDKSSSNVNNITTDSNPVFSEEQLFLKVLVEGKANLYQFIDANLTRFFYKTEVSEIEQLIFKKFKNKQNLISENNGFRQQLWNDLKCESVSMKKISNIDYNKVELLDFFIEYNECNNFEYKTFNKEKKENLFNLNVRFGLNSSNLSIENNATSFKDTDFGNKLGFRFGIEAELILPFNKNKWAVLIEPSYQSFKSDQVKSTGGLNVSVNYESLELPIGVRHYFFLNDYSKLFINGVFVLPNFTIGKDSIIDFENAEDLKIKSSGNFAFGLGYNYDNKYTLEFRMGMSRNVLNTYNSYDSEYNSFSIILGYSIF